MNISQDTVSGICDLMRKCGDIMLSAHAIENEQNSIIDKHGAGNWVTVYDIKVQETLISGLKQLLPDARFLAEEKDNSTVDCNKGYCFVVDPIDGTTNFIHDMRASAISVGLLFDGVPVFGAIFDPYRNEMCVASKGEGASCNGKKIEASRRSIDKSLVSFGTSPYNRDTLAKQSFAAAERIFQQTADIRRSGSAAIDLAFVAMGRSDAFFELLLSPWDYTAGYVILTESGGQLTDTANVVPDFSKTSSVVATNGVIHRELLQLINQ